MDAFVNILNARTLTWYQSLRVKGSIVFFLRPFLPFERRLFLSSSQTLFFEYLRLHHVAVAFHRIAIISIESRELTHFPTAMIAISYLVAGLYCREGVSVVLKSWDRESSSKWFVGGTVKREP